MTDTPKLSERIEVKGTEIVVDAYKVKDGISSVTITRYATGDFVMIYEGNMSNVLHVRLDAIPALIDALRKIGGIHD